MKWITDIENEIAGWLASPEALRTASAALRSVMPIATLDGRALVSRYDDVVAVLADDAHFGVTETYARKMERTTGAFFLGMENTAQYQREAGIARRAVRKDDGARILSLVESETRELLRAARARGGQFDAVAEYSHLVPLGLVARYFGVPGPDPDTMKQWMRSIFWDIFLNPNDDATVSERAQTASAALRPYLVDLVQKRKRALANGDDVADDFVGRLLREQASDPTIDDDLVVRNIGGVIVGAVDTQSKAFAQALDQLLRRPAALASAQKAARTDDDAQVRAHVWEGLRFNPHNPALFRTCHEDTVLAAGTPRATRIKKGTQVVALTISAMFDGEAFPRPDEFLADRSLDAYLHFGHGMHTCLGAHINALVLPAMMKPLLLLENLGYASDRATLEYEGPFPDRMPLVFDVAV
jgi:cytochrome P450